MALRKVLAAPLAVRVLGAAPTAAPASEHALPPPPQRDADLSVHASSTRALAPGREKAAGRTGARPETAARGGLAAAPSGGLPFSAFDFAPVAGFGLALAVLALAMRPLTGLSELRL